jgi:methylmalonyl-CoA/ethylmalonyl-CoA epimerase
MRIIYLNKYKFRPNGSILVPALLLKISIFLYRKSIQMQKVEHIGIAVKDLAASVSLFGKLLGTHCYKTEIVESEKVKTAFFQQGETKIELLESTEEGGVIAKFIEKRGEGIHHLAFEVDDIYTEMKRLLKEGFQLLNPEPKRGADNKLVCFLHPKTTNGVLIELCQSIK